MDVKRYGDGGAVNVVLPASPEPPRDGVALWFMLENIRLGGDSPKAMYGWRAKGKLPWFFWRSSCPESLLPPMLLLALKRKLSRIASANPLEHTRK